MQQESRTVHSIRNMSVGLLNQFLVLILGFVSRTVFITILGAEYLGVNGLFSNILSVLSMAELGIGSAMTFALYKPLALNDHTKIAALMQYYKKLYRIVALIVAVSGGILVPFLPVLVKTDHPIDNITIYYLLFLFNSVTSYFFVYKSTIINADQRMYITKINSFVFYVLQTALQIAYLSIFRDFIGYLVIQVFCTLGSNVFISWKAGRMYPYIRKPEALSAEDKQDLIGNVKSLFLYRIGGVILNNTDNIIISVLIGTIWVGYYSNYFMIINALLVFIGIIFQSVNASVGNLNATDDNGNRYTIFSSMNLMAAWIAGFCAICLTILFNDFITLWIGRKNVLDIATVVAIIINFYMAAIFHPVWIFRDGTGMFRQTKYVFLCTAALNIVLSFLMGKAIGLCGILFATAISRLCTNFWFEPLILHREYFHKDATAYFAKQALYLLLTLVVGSVTYISTSWIDGTHILGFAGKAVICAILPNILFFLAFRKSTDFLYIWDKFLVKAFHRLLTATHITPQ